MAEEKKWEQPTFPEDDLSLPPEVRGKPIGYVVDPNFKPNPLDVGVVRTDGLGGDEGYSVGNYSQLFRTPNPNVYKHQVRPHVDLESGEVAEEEAPSQEVSEEEVNNAHEEALALDEEKSEEAPKGEEEAPAESSFHFQGELIKEDAVDEGSSE